MLPNIVINGSRIERVKTFKLLGVLFNDDLSWSNHVQFILEQVARRYFIIYQLARIGMDCKDTVTVYCSVMRSVLENACAVWHPGLAALPLSQRKLRGLKNGSSTPFFLITVLRVSDNTVVKVKPF